MWYIPKKWFTLVEMLIVIVIIGILAAALIPKITGLQEQAKRTKAVVEMNQINAAIFLLKADTGRGIWWLPQSDCEAGDEILLSVANCGGWLLCDTVWEAVYDSTMWDNYTIPSRWWPYIQETLTTDWWWNPYLYDYDTPCSDNEGHIPLHKCGGNPSGVYQSISSAWPDNIIQPWYTDNEVLIIKCE